MFNNRYLYENSLVDNSNKYSKRNSNEKSGNLGNQNYDLTFNIPE